MEPGQSRAGEANGRIHRGEIEHIGEGAVEIEARLADRSVAAQRKRFSRLAKGQHRTGERVARELLAAILALELDPVGERGAQAAARSACAGRRRASHDFEIDAGVSETDARAMRLQRHYPDSAGAPVSGVE